MSETFIVEAAPGAPVEVETTAPIVDAIIDRGSSGAATCKLDQADLVTLLKCRDGSLKSELAGRDKKMLKDQKDFLAVQWLDAFKSIIQEEARRNTYSRDRNEFALEAESGCFEALTKIRPECPNIVGHARLIIRRRISLCRLSRMLVAPSLDTLYRRRRRGKKFEWPKVVSFSAFDTEDSKGETVLEEIMQSEHEDGPSRSSKRIFDESDLYRFTDGSQLETDIVGLCIFYANDSFRHSRRLICEELGIDHDDLQRRTRRIGEAICIAYGMPINPKRPHNRTAKRSKTLNIADVSLGAETNTTNKNRGDEELALAL